MKHVNAIRKDIEEGRTSDAYEALDAPTVEVFRNQGVGAGADPEQGSTIGTHLLRCEIEDAT